MPVCDRVALLVRSIEPILESLKALQLTVGRIQTVDARGTRELYLGDAGRSGRLLLVQPIDDESPYARALARRGPGLHHIAFTTPDARGFTRAHPHWLLHPHSLESFPATGSLWLARPGIGTLVEVRQGEVSYADKPVVERLEVRVRSAADAAAVEALSGATGLHIGRGRMRLAGVTFDVRRLVGKLS